MSLTDIFKVISNQKKTVFAAVRVAVIAASAMVAPPCLRHVVPEPGQA